jgi:hypothetical protein
MVLVMVSLHAPAQAGMLKRWGFQAGYVSSTQDWEHPYISKDDFSRKSGFHGGVFTEWLDYRVLSVRVAVQYERKGTAYTTEVTDTQGFSLGEQTFYSTLDYLSVPILLKATTGWSPVSPYLLAGPRVDFMQGYSTDDWVWGFEDEWDTISYGLSGGLGIEMPVSGIGQLFVEFVYNYDLSWLFETTVPAGSIFGNPTDVPFRIKNESFLVTAGVGL